MYHCLRLIICLAAMVLLLSSCQDPGAHKTPIPPTVVILQPSVVDGTPTYDEGDGVEFSAQVSDNLDTPDELQIVWQTVYSDGVDTIIEELGTSTASADGLTYFIAPALVGATHSISVTATDSDDLSDTDTIEIIVLETPLDQVPTVAINSPSDGETFEMDEEVDFAATADDDNGPANLTVSWWSNLDGEFDTTVPSDEGWMFVSTDQLSVGDHTIRVTVTDASDQIAEDEITIHINSEPSAPSQPTVQITPANPQTSDDLLCTASGSVDPNGDTVTYLYNWLLDGAQTGNTTDTVLAAETTVSEEWICQVVPTDGQLEGPLGQDSVVVLPNDGDVVISEVQANPDAVNDGSGEWFEVYNNTGETIGLYGWVISDITNGESHTIDDALMILPGHFATLGNNGDMGSNGNVAVDYEYAGFNLDDTVDEIVLSIGVVEVDRVEYDFSGPWPSTAAGQPIMLDMSQLDYVANDDPANWCGSTTSLGAGFDFGTPSDDNDDCDCYASDNDGDIFGDHASCDEDDCDDNNPNVNPNAAEVCDGVADNNCDGTLDGDELDDDGDGMTECDGDCDDGNALVYLGAPENCDGELDNNCDGVNDTNETDDDGDGYSDCDGDCDDGEAAVHPGAADYCDGMDNDCDGAIGEDEIDPYESNDSRASAPQLYSSNSTSTSSTALSDATLHNNSDEDWFYIYQGDPFGGNYSVTGSVTAPAGVTVYLELYKDNSLEDGGPGQTSVSFGGDWLDDDSDNYYFRVVRQSGTADPCETYTLSIASSG